VFQSHDVGYRGAMVKEKPSVLPGLLFGLGFGGFVDGIVLHEILQWHHMISGAESAETLAGLELNVVADGFFHVLTWLLVMAGSITTLVSWRQGRLAPTWSFHFGLLAAGWPSQDPRRAPARRVRSISRPAMRDVAAAGASSDSTRSTLPRR
jgi:hypothetical protein